MGTTREGGPPKGGASLLAPPHHRAQTACAGPPRPPRLQVGWGGVGCGRAGWGGGVRGGSERAQRQGRCARPFCLRTVPCTMAMRLPRVRCRRCCHAALPTTHPQPARPLYHHHPPPSAPRTLTPAKLHASAHTTHVHKHSAAQHSAAWHSAAQHGAAQRRAPRLYTLISCSFCRNISPYVTPGQYWMSLKCLAPCTPRTRGAAGSAGSAGAAWSRRLHARMAAASAGRAASTRGAALRRVIQRLERQAGAKTGPPNTPTDNTTVRGRPAPGDLQRHEDALQPVRDLHAGRLQHLRGRAGGQAGGREGGQPTGRQP